MPTDRFSSKARYIHKRVKPPWKFDKRSFRVISTGKKGIKRVIGCPKGKYDAKRGVCRVGTRTQKVLIPKKR